MRRFLFVVAFVFVFSMSVANGQTPAVVHATWIPNAPSDNVVQYVLTMDATPPVTVLASTCSATLCGPTLLTAGAFGSHTLTIVAQNLKLSTDPTSFQSGPAFSLTFTIGAVPAVVAGGKITN